MKKWREKHSQLLPIEVDLELTWTIDPLENRMTSCIIELFVGEDTGSLKHLMTLDGMEIVCACGAEEGMCALSLADATCPECIAAMAGIDPVVDNVGNRRCACGAIYGGACQNCCKHEHLSIHWDYERGGVPECEQCLKEFTGDEFDSQFVITRR